jgi:hypothetical protein
MAAKSDEDLLNLDELLSVTNSVGGDILDADRAKNFSSFPLSSSLHGSDSAMVLYNFVSLVTCTVL